MSDAIKGAFAHDGKLFLRTESGIYTVQDNGKEPRDWTSEQFSGANEGLETVPSVLLRRGPRDGEHHQHPWSRQAGPDGCHHGHGPGGTIACVRRTTVDSSVQRQTAPYPEPQEALRK